MGGLINKVCGLAALGVTLAVIIHVPGGGRKSLLPPDDSPYEPLTPAAGKYKGQEQEENNPEETSNGNNPSHDTQNNPANNTQNGTQEYAGGFNTQRAIQKASQDSAVAGYCARGVANISEDQGLGNFRGINAHDFPDRLRSQGWVLLEGYTPENAPKGSILTFSSDVRMGKQPRNRGGGMYGHVEFVGINNGQRVYISDTTRTNWGGTVRDNFTGVWVRAN